MRTLSLEPFKLKANEIEIEMSGSMLGFEATIKNAKSLIGLSLNLNGDKIGEVISVSISSRVNSENVVIVRCLLIENLIEGILCSQSF